MRSARKVGPHALGAGHPLLFGFAPALEFDDHPDGGGYPKGFIRKAYETLGVTDPAKVLHVCSGSMRVGVTLDLRQSMKPRVVGDALHLPFRDRVFRWAMADPPYSVAYAENLYGTGDRYPPPKTLLAEVARVLVPGGRVGLLHHMTPLVPPGLRLVKVYGVSTGCGYQMRAWTVLERPDDSMPLFEPPHQ